MAGLAEERLDEVVDLVDGGRFGHGADFTKGEHCSRQGHDGRLNKFVPYGGKTYKKVKTVR